MAALWLLSNLGGAPPVLSAALVHLPRSVENVLGLIYLVWMLNLTNFMDGIDGIAGVEVVTVCLSGAFIGAIVAPDQNLWITPTILAFATVGFLIWNWPPASIFMGDAGSGFLGLMMAALSVQAGWALSRLFWSWAILLGVFIVDATVTLAVRVARGERFYEAHRNHAYQHAAIRRGAHLPVIMTVGIINLCWLLPIALAVALGWMDVSSGLALAYAPLVMIVVGLGAGRPRAV